jgi:peptidoglycan/xylan/chitin deacetylase (PgdA/CDA1 family)
MKRQKAALERAIGKEVVSVRQHYLHYDIRITPAVQAAAGFKYDSTLGFNDNVGFQFGTCHPWHLYDLKAEKELPIKEIPLIIQDGAMLNPDKGMRLDENTAFRYVVQLAGEVEKVGGVLTLLWHPNHNILPEWWNLYLRTLEYLNGRNAWFGSVREIGGKFRQDQQD